MPRIAVIGTSCVGKSTFINDFLEKFPEYKKSAGNYRKIVKEKKLSINKQGTKEGQNEILNSLLDEIMAYKNTDNVIHDRIPLDNLVYSMYLNAKNLGDVDDKFISYTMNLVKESMRFIDLIFFIPLLEKYDIPVEEKENREVDLEYRKEIDNIFKVIQETYHANMPMVFPLDDKDGSPPVIEIFGTREQRIEMVKLYLDENGQFFKESDSLIRPVLEGIDDNLIKQLLKKDSKNSK